RAPPVSTLLPYTTLFRSSLRVAGHDLANMNDGQLAKFRSSTLGFIFQQYNLMPVLTALDNVELPLLLTSLSSKERKKRAQTALRSEEHTSELQSRENLVC